MRNFCTEPSSLLATMSAGSLAGLGRSSAASRPRSGARLRPAPPARRCVERARLGGRDVHRQVLAEVGVAAGHVDQHADLGAAVHVAGDRALGFHALEAADRHVLADLAHQRGTRRLDRAFAERQRRQRGDVGRAFARRPVAASFAANARKSSFLATKSVSQFTSTIAPSLPSALTLMATMPSAATRLDAFAALLPSLTRRISSALREIAAGLGQRLLALHHRRVGLLAQFLDHCCGDFRHRYSQTLANLREHSRKGGCAPPFVLWRAAYARAALPCLRRGRRF